MLLAVVESQLKFLSMQQFPAAAVSEASDLSNTAINPTSVTITASENGIMTTLTDLGRNASPRNVAADIGKLFGKRLQKNRHRLNSII